MRFKLSLNNNVRGIVRKKLCNMLANFYVHFVRAILRVLHVLYIHDTYVVIGSNGIH